MNIPTAKPETEWETNYRKQNRVAEVPPDLSGAYVRPADYSKPAAQAGLRGLTCQSHVQALQGLAAFESAIIPISEARKLAAYLTALADAMQEAAE